MRAFFQCRRPWRCRTFSCSPRSSFSELQNIQSESVYGLSFTEKKNTQPSTAELSPRLRTWDYSFRSTLPSSDQKTLALSHLQINLGLGSLSNTSESVESSLRREQTSYITSTLRGFGYGRNLCEFCSEKGEKHAKSGQDGFTLRRNNSFVRALHTAAAKFADMEALQPASSSTPAEELEEELQEDLEMNVAVYEELKEYVHTKYPDKPVLVKMVEDYNPLAEMKEPKIVDFRPPDRELPPLDRVTIELDTEEQYRVTRKTKWVTKQLRLPVMNDVPALLEQWVKTMYPKRSDWLDLLKEFSKDENELNLFFQVFEFALLEETFEVKSQDLTRILVKYMNLERYDDVDRLMGTIDEKGFPPDFVVCTLLLDMNCKLKRLEKAREMYDRIRSLSYVPDVAGCTKLIEFYCEMGNPEAGEMILAEMEDEKLHGTVDTYLAVIKGYGKVGRASDAVRIFKIMREDIFLRPDIGPDVYSELMNVYVQANMLPSAVLTMEDMLLSDMEPMDESISLLIAAYEKKNQFEKALDVLLKLESQARRPGVHTLTTLIRWFGKMGLVEEAEILFKWIEEVDIPDGKAYASLFSTYARAGLIDKARATLRCAEEQKVLLDSSAYEQMIIALLGGKQREEAQSLRDRMIAEGFTPSDEVEKALLGVEADSFLSGVSKALEEETQSLGGETDSFLSGVSKSMEQQAPPESEQK